MTWTIDVAWDGLNLADVPASVDVSSSIAIGSGAWYSPRTYTVTVQDLVSVVRPDRDPSTCVVVIKYNGERVASPLVRRVSAGPWPSFATLVCADRPIPNGRKIPDGVDVRARLLDLQAIADAQKQAEDRARWEQEHYAGDWGRQGRYNAVTALSWGLTYSDEALGRPYPLVFGKPGRDGTPAYQAIPVDSAEGYVLVGGEEVTPGTVSIFRVLASSSEVVPLGTKTVEHVSDLTGRRVAVVQLDTVTEYDQVDAYHVAMDGTAHGLSSHPCDVILYLGSRSDGVRMDVVSVEEHRDRLAPYLLDTALVARESCWRLLSESVIPLLPVRLVPTANGIGLAWWSRLSPPPLRPHVEVGITAGRVSGFAVHPPTASEATVIYRRSSIGGRGTVYQLANGSTVSAGAVSDATPTQGDVIETPWVYDAQTATIIARERAAWGGLTFDPIEVLCLPGDHGVEGSQPLTAGTWVDLTDAAAGFDRRLGVVVSEERSGPMLQVSIQPL